VPASACAAGRAAAGIGQEAPQDAREVEPPQHAPHLVLGEDVVGDEAAEPLAQPLLLARDDGGVRDGQPSGRRNSAVTANQSARPPTTPAFAAAWSRSVQ
jgi:hypothetical protein